MQCCRLLRPRDEYSFDRNDLIVLSADLPPAFAAVRWFRHVRDIPPHPRAGIIAGATAPDASELAD